MMNPYDPELPLATLTNQLEKGRAFAQMGLQTISENMMVTKGITLLANTAVFNDDIKQWRRTPDNEKTWEKFKSYFHRAHKERRKAITTAGQGGYNAKANSIYGVPTTEEHEAQLDLQERAAESLETISDGLSTHQDSISELTQANAVLTNNNTTMAAQMAHKAPMVLPDQLPYLYWLTQHGTPDRQCGLRYYHLGVPPSEKPVAEDRLLQSVYYSFQS